MAYNVSVTTNTQFSGKLSRSTKNYRRNNGNSDHTVNDLRLGGPDNFPVSWTVSAGGALLTFSGGVEDSNGKVTGSLNIHTPNDRGDSPDSWIAVSDGFPDDTPYGG